MLSPDCKVCIGGTVYDFCDLGGPSTAAGEVGDRSSMLCIGGCCTFGDSKDFFTFPTDPTQKFKVKVSLKNFPIVLHLAQAKMVSYKLRSNGNSWKRTKNLKEVRVTGSGRVGPANDCAILGPVNTFKIKRRRHLACRFKEWGPPTIYAVDNDIFGSGIINNFSGTSAAIPLIMF